MRFERAPRGRERARPERGAGPTHPGAIGGLALLLIAAVVCVWLYRAVFIVKSVSVEGLTLLDAQTVIELSGVREGASIFSVSDGALRRGIESSRYLTYAGKRVALPDHVTLIVRENLPAAQFQWAGRTLMLAGDLTVLEDSARYTQLLPIPTLAGLSPANTRVGEKARFTVPGQGEALEAVLRALETQGLNADIATVDLASLDNIVLITHGSLFIQLGRAENLDAKLTLADSALARLTNDPAFVLTNSILDVSSGIYADCQGCTP